MEIRARTALYPQVPLDKGTHAGQKLSMFNVHLSFIVLKINREKKDQIVAILQENIELARIITASIRTAKSRNQLPPK
jgi:hypothetical protein